MRKTGIVFSVMLVCGAATAEPLADAQKLWEQKNFSAAYAAFSVLAERGNADAQLQLGEMIGFGEGTREDSALAADWLKKAQAGGNPEAAASLALVRERAARKPEIARYADSFDGAALAYDKYQCVRPAIPALSTKNSEIADVNAGVNAWSACYGRFARALNQALPATRTIPADILKLMSNAEFVKADAAINSAYEKIAADAQKIANQVSADNAAWKAATEQYVVQNNAKVNDTVIKTKAEYDQIQREAAEEVTRRRIYAQGRKKS